MEGLGWSNLPEHVVVRIFSLLPVGCRFQASLICRNWNLCAQSQYLWSHFEFEFKTENDNRLLKCAPKYGHFLRSIVIRVDQQFSYNRTNACQAIYDIGKHRNVRKIKIQFIGLENPTFYSGKEFTDALKYLFGAANQVGLPADQNPADVNQLKDVNQETDRLSCPATPDSNSNAVGQSSESKEENHLAVSKPTVFLDIDEASNLSDSSIYLPANRFDPNLIVEGQLREVDLSGFLVCIDDSFISYLALYHQNLEKLNIQNNVLVVKVSDKCLLQIVQKCRKLRELRVYMCSMSSETLACLAETNRTPLEHLSLYCCRYEKYVKDIDRASWKSLCDKLPSLRVTLIFDHNCPLFRVREIMKSEIPVSVLRLETQTSLHDEVLQAANFYGDTLEKVVIRAPPPRVGPTLDSAVLALAVNCSRLRSLHVFSVLEQATVEKILELHPVMTKRGAYTLKYKPEAHPWVAGHDA